MNDESELTVTVTRRRMIAAGVVELEFRTASGLPLPPWSPGAHIDLLLPTGLVRQYSLCGNPADHDAWHIAVLREPASRGGSQYLNDQVEEGHSLQIRGPRNNFELEVAAEYLFVAGGIGVTPILTMVEQAHRAGADWRLLYGGRTLASMAYLDRLASLPSDRVAVRPEDDYGLLDLPEYLAQSRPDALVYCCGPEGLLAAVERECDQWPRKPLRVERFAARELEEPMRSGSFTIDLRKSGITCVVPPGRSILDVIREAGVEVPTSCEEGTCGTCQTSLLAGVAEHRDSILSPAEQASNETIFICVSRALSDALVLDL